MIVREYRKETDDEMYQNWLKVIAPNTVWQSMEWANYCKAKGEQVAIYLAIEGDTILASALCVISVTTLGFSTWNIPKGPIFSSQAAALTLLEYIVRKAKTTRCIEIYTSREQIMPKFPGSKPSHRYVFPEASIIIDIRESLEDIKAKAKPKARYNGELALKNNVRIERSTDALAFAKLHSNTGKRNTFITPQNSYTAFIHNVPGAFLLYAFIPECTEPIAGLIGLVYGNTGIYYYGASNYEYRKYMAPYALQWAAIEHCKAQGALYYDMFGIAPKDAKDHPWQGITEFKEKFGGTYVAYIPEETIVLRPLIKTIVQLKRWLRGKPYAIITKNILLLQQLATRRTTQTSVAKKP